MAKKKPKDEEEQEGETVEQGTETGEGYGGRKNVEWE